jgi:hypothetical protein
LAKGNFLAEDADQDGGGGGRPAAPDILMRRRRITPATCAAEITQMELYHKFVVVFVYLMGKPSVGKRKH